MAPSIGCTSTPMAGFGCFTRCIRPLLALAHQHLRTAVDTMLALAAPAMADGDGQAERSTASIQQPDVQRWEAAIFGKALRPHAALCDMTT